MFVNSDGDDDSSWYLFFLLRWLKQFFALRFCCVVITTIYRLMLQSLYQKTAQSLVNINLVSQQVTTATVCPAKTPLSTALGAYNSKTVH